MTGKGNTLNNMDSTKSCSRSSSREFGQKNKGIWCHGWFNEFVNATLSGGVAEQCREPERRNQAVPNSKSFVAARLRRSLN